MTSGADWRPKATVSADESWNQVTTLVTPDTILRWHRHLIARKWTYEPRRPGRPGVLQQTRRLTVQMARENPTWGYRRIQGALKNIGHRVARSTIAKTLKAHGISPVPDRPLFWRTFLAAHLGETAAADFFTTEVWTRRGLITYYTLFIIEGNYPLDDPKIKLYTSVYDVNRVCPNIRHRRSLPQTS